jgi:uncharacterized RDD family membrane protein YckC
LEDRAETIQAAPAYGRFSRRLQAILIDWMIFLVLMAAALSVTTALQSDDVGRILGFTFVALLLLYEPVLVPLTGGTIGHYLRNLRVVDDRTSGNIGVLKAVARVVIKSALGLFSFITMGTTLRHQALHDVLTRSTVQIRDLSRASPSQYVSPRTELLNPGMPSWRRRLVVVVAYFVAILVAGVLAYYVAETAGYLTRACIEYTARCSPREKWIRLGLELSPTIAWVVCTIQGWRGKLWGCRLRRQPALVSPGTRS